MVSESRKLKPRLRPNLINSRHYYRGVVWYVLTSTSNPTTLRLDSSAFHLLSSFDGETTVDDVWQNALTVLGDDAPTQDETVSLLADLFEAALVEFQQASDVERLFENARSKQTKEALSRYLNPLFMRFSLLDPDRLTQKILPWTAWLFTPITLWLWIALMIVGATTAAVQIDGIKAEMSSGLFSPQSLIIFWCVFPVMKLIHEAAHALAVRRWGGEVHDCGIALLVLIPVPYVDASESARFANKYRRMAVAAAGILVESSLAALGLAVWVLVEPGLVRDVAFNVFITGSVSSLLFNGNPLLKFDSYYVLSDFVEIPNLATRSTRFLVHLLKKYFLGVASHSPVVAKGEAVWFVVYGLAAFVYRISLTIAICLFVAGKYFFIGVLLAFWSLGMQVGRPLFKALKFLLSDPAVQGARGRAYAATAGGIVAIVAVLFAIPVTSATHARGVVWPIDDATLRAQADCLVIEVFAVNGASVSPGDELIRCDATFVEARVKDLESDLLAARARVFSTRDRVERGLRQSEMETAARLLETARDELQGISLQANATGAFFAHDASNLVGRYFSEGEIVGYVLSEGNLSIRTMLDQERAALLEKGRDNVSLRLADDPETAFESTIIRRVPAASAQLAAPALSVSGGGDLVTASDERGQERLDQPAFEVELALPVAMQSRLVGSPVEIRFRARIGDDC